MKRCRIQWVDEKTDEPTPDKNKAVGEVWRIAYELGGVTIPESERFPICEEHLKEFRKPGTERWMFQFYPEKGGKP